MYIKAEKMTPFDIFTPFEKLQSIQVMIIYECILRRAQNFAKSSSYFWLALHTYQSFFSDTSQAVLDPGLNEYQQA